MKGSSQTKVKKESMSWHRQAGTDKVSCWQSTWVPGHVAEYLVRVRGRQRKPWSSLSKGAGPDQLSPATRIGSKRREEGRRRKR
jgi:hypothetical protein